MASTPTRTKYYSGAYAPFGESYAETGTTDRSFTGNNEDTVAGMADFMFREYSSNQQGRWISPDPAGLAAVNPTNPQSWNRYAYASNTPLTVIDPLGLYTCGNCPPIDNGPPDQSDLFESGWFIDDIGSHFEPLQAPNSGGGGDVPDRPLLIRKLTPAQCDAIETLLAREQKYGTTEAAYKSAIGYGDGTVKPFNSSDGKTGGMVYVTTAAGQVKLDWFTNIRGVSTLIPGPQVPAYTLGKLGWTVLRLATGAPITNYLPWTDPVETHTAILTIEGYGFRDLFPNDFMKKYCGSQYDKSVQ